MSSANNKPNNDNKACNKQKKWIYNVTDIQNAKANDRINKIDHRAYRENTEIIGNDQSDAYKDDHGRE